MLFLQPGARASEKAGGLCAPKGGSCFAGRKPVVEILAFVFPQISKNLGLILQLEDSPACLWKSAGTARVKRQGPAGGLMGTAELPLGLGLGLGLGPAGADDTGGGGPPIPVRPRLPCADPRDPGGGPRRRRGGGGGRPPSGSPRAVLLRMVCRREQLASQKCGLPSGQGSWAAPVPSCPCSRSCISSQPRRHLHRERCRGPRGGRGSLGPARCTRRGSPGGRPSMGTSASHLAPRCHSGQLLPGTRRDKHKTAGRGRPTAPVTPQNTHRHPPGRVLRGGQVSSGRGGAAWSPPTPRRTLKDTRAEPLLGQAGRCMVPPRAQARDARSSPLPGGAEDGVLPLLPRPPAGLGVLRTPVEPSLMAPLPECVEHRRPTGWARGPMPATQVLGAGAPSEASRRLPGKGRATGVPKQPCHAGSSHRDWGRRSGQ